MLSYNKLKGQINSNAFPLYIYSTLALTEPPRELYEDDPKSGSMLSLVHSNSSTSVGPNSL